MRIGLNLLFLDPGETGGMETYARALVPMLPDAIPEAELFAFAGRELSEEWRSRPWSDQVRLVELPVRSGTRVRRTVAEQALVGPKASRLGIDLVHSLSQPAPIFTGVPAVVTVHDLIYISHPEAHSWPMRRGLSLLVPASARSATRIISPSESTARDLESLLSMPRERIDVVPEGPGRPPQSAPVPEGTIRERFELGDRPVVLSVSARRGHKNLERLIEALALVPEAVLVLPGYPTASDEQLMALATRVGVADRVRLCGWVDDSELEGLYGAATCMVFPSLAEGFGLPVLEAMSRRVPVATSASTALAEVAGDAALLFDPCSVQSIGDAIGRLVRDGGLREALVELGAAQAGRFSWQAAAEGTALSYRKALRA